MFWYLIGYVLMGIFGADFVVGVILGVVALRRGYLDDVGRLANDASNRSWERCTNNAFSKMLPKNIMGYTVWRAFYIMTWPVELLRNIFIDSPDAIEYYEAQQDGREAA